MMKRFFAMASLGKSLMANPIALITPAFATAFFMTHLVIQNPDIQSWGVALQVIFAVTHFFLLLCILVDYVFAPLWGLYYYLRIGKDFGPKTRSIAWSSFMERRPQCVDLYGIAAEVGEQPKSPGKRS